MNITMTDSRLSNSNQLKTFLEGSKEIPGFKNLYSSAMPLKASYGVW